MRNTLRRLWRILSAPVRALTWPFVKFHEFLNFEPEDSPTAEVISRSFNDPSLLIDHIDALRKHLLRSVVALVLATAIGALFARQVLDWLARPIGGIESLQSIEVTESVGAFMRVALMAGFAIAMPYILLELLAFIHPGLKRNERINLLISIPIATLLFLLGMAFAYRFMLPTALPFLLDFMGIETIPRPSNYIRFVVGMMFWIGIAFQFPLIIFILARLGFVDSGMLIRGWRFAVLGIAILAAIITPTIDPVNMALVMAPMIVLYFLSILLAAFAQKRRSVAAENAD
jgi:sec-independent protein translocase protein TatC